MRILVNGSSVSSGNSVLQTKIECNLINLSLFGAGNNWWNPVTNHPTLSAYSHYAGLVIQRIEQTTGHLPCRI